MKSKTVEKGQHIHQGYEVLRKKPSLPGKKSTSCVIYVPKEWKNKEVAIIRLE